MSTTVPGVAPRTSSSTVPAAMRPMSNFTWVDFSSVADSGLVIEHLLNGVIDVCGTRDLGGRSRLCGVDFAVGEGVSHGWPQHAERVARRARVARCPCVHRRDLNRLVPLAVVEVGRLPTGGMGAGVEGFQRQACHIAGCGHGRPGLASAGLPRVVADDPLAAELGLERHTPCTQGVRRWGRHPPGCRGAEVPHRQCDHIGALVQKWSKVSGVVVAASGIAPDRSACHLAAVDLQHVATVDPDAAGHPVGDCSQLKRSSEEPHTPRRVCQDRPGRGLGSDLRTFVPDPPPAPLRLERGWVA